MMFIYWLRLSLLIVLSGIVIFMGVTHFGHPAPFVSIVPSYLPHPRTLVAVSGFFEVLGGVGLLIPFSRRAASIGLIALFIAVFPANVNMALHNVPIEGHHYSLLLLWLRLPLQLVLIVWAWWCGTLKQITAKHPEGI